MPRSYPEPPHPLVPQPPQPYDSTEPRPDPEPLPDPPCQQDPPPESLMTVCDASPCECASDLSPPERGEARVLRVCMRDYAAVKAMMGFLHDIEDLPCSCCHAPCGPWPEPPEPFRPQTTDELPPLFPTSPQ